MTPAEVLAGMRPLSPGRRVKVGGRATAAEIVARGVVGAVRGQLAHRPGPARVAADDLVAAAFSARFEETLDAYSAGLRGEPVNLTF
ncbi:hypothetical protein ACF064_01455 [Streptomyces sp. NPDC015492]|uniref:hypothetical protein n=1 Tax=Streptomyces sp. NPDC015492 TaxID=3364958 RepID=UPI0037030B05